MTHLQIHVNEKNNTGTHLP